MSRKQEIVDRIAEVKEDLYNKNMVKGSDEETELLEDLIDLENLLAELEEG